METQFPKQIRLRKSESYKRVYDHGNRKVGRFLQILYRPNGLEQPRYGVSVGSRLGNAVKRNKVKRWIREAIRRNKGSVRSGVDIVVHPKGSVLIADSGTIERELQSLLASINRKGDVAIFDQSNTNRSETV